MTGQRPVLSAIQLRRAIDNAGGLWLAGELQKIGVIRGDKRDELPVGVNISGATYRCGYEMRDFAERKGRASSAEAMADAILKRQATVAKLYAKPDVKPSRKGPNPKSIYPKV